MAAAMSSTSGPDVPARAKLAIPKTLDSRFRSSGQSADGPSVTSIRPISARTRITSRSAVAARRLLTSRSMNQGRLRPLSAISW